MKQLWVWLFKDLGLKLVALSLAVLSWLMVLQQGVVERSIRTTVQLQGLQGNMMLVRSATSIFGTAFARFRKCHLRCE